MNTEERNVNINSVNFVSFLLLFCKRREKKLRKWKKDLDIRKEKLERIKGNKIEAKKRKGKI